MIAASATAIAIPASATAIALLLVLTGVADHGGSDQVSQPSVPVSVTSLVHTPCVYVNPGGQWRGPPGALPPEFP